mmetsp:Transcript_101489/g.316456  ORF Transcript_101489/g.316456 Transcript_101489/m.316456 type:complete len:302 (+) Transcript_101489:92-997(+)
MSQLPVHKGPDHGPEKQQPQDGGWARASPDAEPRPADPSQRREPALRSRSPHRKPTHATLEDAESSSDGDLDAEEDRQAKALRVEALLPKEAQERLRRLYDEGLVARGAFDFEALLALRALSPELQEKVFLHLESERIFLLNSRSKSGFLTATCDKARTGSLDARGVGLPDPWRASLLAIAVPRRVQVDLVPELRWMEQHGAGPAQITVDVSVDKEVGVGSITLALGLAHSVASVKSRLAAIGVKIPVHKMKLKEATAGFLKDDKTLAFYNIRSGSFLHLVYKARGGVALRRDQSVQVRCK